MITVTHKTLINIYVSKTHSVRERTRRLRLRSGFLQQTGLGKKYDFFFSYL